LRKSSKTIDSEEKINEVSINCCFGNDEPTNQYRKSVIIIGIRKLFEAHKGKNFR
jgi:hypothetical protein